MSVVLRKGGQEFINWCRYATILATNPVFSFTSVVRRPRGSLLPDTLLDCLFSKFNRPSSAEVTYSRGLTGPLREYLLVTSRHSSPLQVGGSQTLSCLSKLLFAP